jgi:ribosomal protein L4
MSSIAGVARRGMGASTPYFSSAGRLFATKPQRN